METLNPSDAEPVTVLTGYLGAGKRYPHPQHLFHLS